VVIGGAVVAAVALAVAWGVLPWARRMRDRGLLLDAERVRAERLATLAAARDSLTRAADALDAAPPAPRGLLAAPDAALGASALQEALQATADLAGVRVTRLDVSGLPESLEGTTALPATLEAQGDVHGVAALTALLRRGPVALDLRELAITASPVSTHGGRPLLDVVAVVRAPVREGAMTAPAPPVLPDSIAQAITAADPFHPSRRPPREPYRPDAIEAPADPAPVPTADEAVPRLLGIVRGAGGPRALLRLDPARRDAQLYGVGARDAGYRVVGIGADRVTLDGPAGRVELVLTVPEVRP
jgi:hypothetical protein